MASSLRGCVEAVRRVNGLPCRSVWVRAVIFVKLGEPERSIPGSNKTTKILTLSGYLYLSPHKRRFGRRDSERQGLTASEDFDQAMDVAPAFETGNAGFNPVGLQKRSFGPRVCR